MNEQTVGLPLSRIVLKGYKSIKNCELRFKSLNVLIGANGAGKSNFVSVFKMVQQILENNLQLYVGRQGGPDALLHFGRKKTAAIDFELYFNQNGYICKLEPTADNRLMFANEAFCYAEGSQHSIGGGHFETQAHTGTKTDIDRHVVQSIRGWRVYHFHDTGDGSLIKQRHSINDNTYLRPDARNLAAYLYYLKQSHPNSYQKIVKTIRLVAPFFGDFHLRPNPVNADMIELEWVQKGEDLPFKAHYLSDGTLRFICLAAVLLQPECRQPATILIDEPELGLHPYAIVVLASLLKSAAINKQIIVSTQSVELVSEFEPEDLVVVDHKKGESHFSRLESEKLEEWLKEYSLGELWKKNIFGGRPGR